MDVTGCRSLDHTSTPDHRDPEASRSRIDDGGVMPTAGVTEQTYYRWKAKYGGMESGDAKKMKQLGGGEPEAEAGSGRTDAG